MAYGQRMEVDNVDNLCKVEITVEANASKYWALMAYKDAKGTRHEKKIEAERSASTNSNHIQALIEALGALNRPCMLDVFTSCDYLIAPFQQGWITSWEKNGWTNAKGNAVRNAEQWKELRRKLTDHSARFMHKDKNTEV